MRQVGNGGNGLGLSREDEGSGLLKGGGRGVLCVFLVFFNGVCGAHARWVLVGEAGGGAAQAEVAV